MPSEASSPISILLVGQASRCQEIKCILLESGIKHELAEAGSCAEAKRFLADNRTTVVLCEKQLEDGNWRDILECADYSSQSEPSVVVCHPHADDRLWVEVLNLGAHDLIQLPTDKDELIRVIESAHRACPKVQR